MDVIFFAEWACSLELAAAAAAAPSVQATVAYSSRNAAAAAGTEPTIAYLYSAIQSSKLSMDVSCDCLR